MSNFNESPVTDGVNENVFIFPTVPLGALYISYAAEPVPSPKPLTVFLSQYVDPAPVNVQPVGGNVVLVNPSQSEPPPVEIPHNESVNI